MTMGIGRTASGFSMEKMLAAREGVKALRKQSKKDNPKHPGLGTPIDWRQIQFGFDIAPLISFHLPENLRNSIIQLLTSDKATLSVRAKQRRLEFVSKFRQEFSGVYCRYRNEVYKSKGKTLVFILHAKEVKYVDASVISCLQSNIEPLNVLNYWHKKLSSFASNVDCVTLSLLANSSAISEASINQDSDNRTASDLDESDVANWKPAKRNTAWLGDVSTLHPRLRRDLMGAGFNLSRYNDADLAAIQDYALIAKTNRSVKFVPEDSRDMVRWALKNTLKNCVPEDFLCNRKKTL